jgi:hypothetical protein
MNFIYTRGTLPPSVFLLVGGHYKKHPHNADAPRLTYKIKFTLTLYSQLLISWG